MVPEKGWHASLPTSRDGIEDILLPRDWRASERRRVQLRRDVAPAREGVAQIAWRGRQGVGSAGWLGTWRHAKCRGGRRGVCTRRARISVHAHARGVTAYGARSPSGGGEGFPCSVGDDIGGKKARSSSVVVLRC